MRLIPQPARRVLAGAPLLLIALVTVACGAGMAAPSTLAPPTSSGARATAPPAPLPTVRPSTTTTAAVTSTSTTPAVVAPSSTFPLGMQNPNVSDTMLSADGPWQRVDAAPGVTQPGLVYQLRERVWVYLPLQEDFAHNVLWTFHEIDREVIEGYLRAQVQRLPADAGVVLRPQVLGDDRSDTTALVADCVLPAGGGVAHGEGFSLELRDGTWVVLSSYPREDACW